MSEGNIVFMNGQYHNTTNWGVVQWANYYDYLHGTQEDPNAIGGVFQEPTFFGDENYPGLSYVGGSTVTPGIGLGPFGIPQVGVTVEPFKDVDYSPVPDNPDAVPAVGENPRNGVYTDVNGKQWSHLGNNIWTSGTGGYFGNEPWSPGGGGGGATPGAGGGGGKDTGIGTGGGTPQQQIRKKINEQLKSLGLDNQQVEKGTYVVHDGVIYVRDENAQGNPVWKQVGFEGGIDENGNFDPNAIFRHAVGTLYEDVEGLVGEEIWIAPQDRTPNAGDTIVDQNGQIWVVQESTPDIYMGEDGKVYIRNVDVSNTVWQTAEDYKDTVIQSGATEADDWTNPWWWDTPTDVPQTVTLPPTEPTPIVTIPQPTPPISVTFPFPTIPSIITLPEPW